MDYNKLNDEQLESLNFERKRNISIYEKESNIIDAETGEILRQESEIIRKGSEEPDFIKLYYRTMLAFNGVRDIPLEFIVCLSGHISWSNNGSAMIFLNNKFNRENICEACDIKEAMYKRYIARCKDNGILIPMKGYRGTYEVNPFFIAKGRWKSIKDLRAEFDFSEGKWIRTIKSDNEDIPEDEENANLS